MALSHVTKMFAVEDAKIYKMTADPAGGTTTYGTAVDVPGIKSVTISGDIENKELRGDNTLLDSNSVLTGLSVAWENAKLSTAVLEILLGGATVDSGTTPNQIATYTLLNSDVLSYFKFEAKSPTGGSDAVTGDIHFIFPKCIVSEFGDLGLAEEDYQLTSGAAKCLQPLGTGGKRMQVVINETAAAIA
jgi:hypothetical protein